MKNWLSKNKKILWICVAMGGLVCIFLLSILFGSDSSSDDRHVRSADSAKMTEVLENQLSETPYDAAHFDAVRIEDVDSADPKLLPERSMTALFVINHINWVVTKIKNYNNPAVLEEEYKNICSDALNLNAIHDFEIIELIQDIMDAITDMRIEEKERELLKEELDQGSADAMFDAISGIGTGGGATPAAAVFNIVTSAAMAGVNYKRAKRRLMQTYKKQTWSLDKGRMLYLNDLNKSLLQRYWVIVQRYNLPDQYRVSERDVEMLINHLKDTDSRRLHSFLCSMEKKFSGLQNYWYYRGLVAEQISDRKDAKKALEAYQKSRDKYMQILRVDGIAAKAAMLQVKIMLEENSSIKGNSDEEKKIRHLLDEIKSNSTIDEWQAYYFCALVYADYLRDIESAEATLLPVIHRLEFQRDNKLIDWKDLVEEKKDEITTDAVAKMLPTGDALFECRTFLLHMKHNKLNAAETDKRLAAICDDASTSAREKLFCYCLMDYKRALDKIIPDLQNIMVQLVDDGGKTNVKLSMPLSWEMSFGGDMYFGLSKQNSFDKDKMDFDGFDMKNEVGERSLEVRDDGLNCSVVDFGEIEDLEEIKKIVYAVRYDRGSRSVMVVLEYDYDSKDGKHQLKPKKAYFGKWHESEELGKSGWGIAPKDEDQKKFDGVEHVFSD